MNIDSDDDDYMSMMIQAAERESMMDEVDPDVLAEMESLWDNNAPQQQPAKTVNNNNNNDDDDDIDDIMDIEERQQQQPSPPLLEQHFDEDYVLKRAPHGLYVNVTSGDGRRVYLKLSSNIDNKLTNFDRIRRQRSAKRRRANDLKLLNTPVKELLSLIDANEREERLQHAVDNDNNEQQQQQPSSSSLQEYDELWVTKFSPKTYFELLSDEKLNRCVLKWLKHWNPIVFPTNNKNNKNDYENTFVRPNNFFVSPNRKQHHKHQQQQQQQQSSSNELMKQPKVLLLAGAPGLGKTTLAHVIATQLGYRPVEINASDDRSAPVLMKKIRNAVEMQSMFTDSRPNCVILDEIDGAMGGGSGGGGNDSAINALVKLIQGGGRGTNGKRMKPLNRPIICTCNNLYTRALRPLRSISQVYTFKPISKKKLLERLIHICSVEDVRADRRVLTNLIEMCNFDIRSCLNALQFLAKSKQCRITMNDLENVPISSKDEVQDRVTIWRQIFNNNTSGNDRISVGKNKRKKTTIQTNSKNEVMINLLNTLEGYGDYEGILNGVHENYTNVSYGDPTFDKSVQASEWLSLSEVFIHDIHAKQHQMMRQYMPYCFIGVHKVIATQRTFRPQFPTTDYFTRQLREQSFSLLDSLVSPNSMFGKWFLSRRTIVLDVVSPLLSILSPNIRPVNFQLLSDREKVDVTRLIDTMISLDISYKQTKPSYYSKHDTSQWKMMPNIEELIRFDHLRVKQLNNTPHWLRNSQSITTTTTQDLYQSNIRQMPPLLVELLKREIQHESLRRRAENDRILINDDDDDGGDNSKKVVRTLFPPPSSSSSSSPKKRTTSVFKETLAKKQKRSKKKKKKKKKDVLISPASKRKRTFLAEHESKLAEARNQLRKTYPIRFKFHEGFTNAVRRSVKVEEFVSNNTAYIHTTLI